MTKYYDLIKEIDDKIPVLELSMEDGSEIECILLASFVLYDESYAALFPTYINGRNDEILFLYRILKDSDENYRFENIVEDEVQDMVMDEFNAVSEFYNCSAIIDEFLKRKKEEN